jgi:hypothetical protein
MTHRVFKLRQLGCSPLTGADLSGLSDLDHSPAPLEDPPTPDYFFISKFLRSLRTGEDFSLVPTASRLTEGGTVSRLAPLIMEAFLAIYLPGLLNITEVLPG